MKEARKARILCPVCGCGGVHMGMVTVKQGVRVDVITAKESIRHAHDDLPTPDRGSRVTVLMHCEEGHVFDFSMVFHKGEILVDVKHLPEESAEHMETLWRD